jgi:hypothetical protein
MIDEDECGTVGEMAGETEELGVILYCSILLHCIVQ